MAEPITAIPNRTSTQTMLDQVRAQYARVAAQFNPLATRHRQFETTLRQQIALSQGNHARTNRQLMEEYQRAIADTRSAMAQLEQQAAPLRREGDRLEGLIRQLEGQLASEQRTREAARRNPPRTDNQQPTPSLPSADQLPTPENDEEITGDGGTVVITGQRWREFEPKDHRVRLSAFVGQENEVYGPPNRADNVLAPLHETQGLLFPYTPTISVSQDTSWQAADLEHANYDILSFQKSSSASISLTAKFTVQNQREGEYMFAAIHYLRTVSKMYFGSKDGDRFESAPGEGDNAAADSAESIRLTRVSGKAGTPPPTLILSGYGDLMFNNIRCVVKSHSWSFEESADMVKVVLPVGSTVWLPPLLTVNITLAMQTNTDDLRETFSLDEFRTGQLLRGNRKGWF